MKWPLSSEKLLLHCIALCFTTVFTYGSRLRFSWTTQRFFIRKNELLVSPCWGEAERTGKLGERQRGYMCLMSVCVCMCVWERGREREWEGGDRQQPDSVCQQPHGFSTVCVLWQRETVCAYMCVCVSQGEALSERPWRQERERESEDTKKGASSLDPRQSFVSFSFFVFWKQFTLPSRLYERQQQQCVCLVLWFYWSIPPNTHPPTTPSGKVEASHIKDYRLGAVFPPAACLEDVSS